MIITLTINAKSVQKRAIRTICKLKYRDHTEPLFKKENILKVNDVFKLHVNLFMYDYRQNHLPESFNNFSLITYKETQIIVDVQIHFIANDHELNSLPHCPNTTFQKCGTIPLAILKN